MRWGVLRAVASLAAVSCWAATDFSLIDAVKRRDIHSAEALLAKHVNVNAALPDGATALSWAVFLDLPDLAGKLIQAGANVNTAGEYGETPLTLALANADVALAARLLKAGADPKAARWNGETTLMIAAGAGSVEEVKLLLAAGVDVNGAEPRRGQNALMWAAAEGHPDVVDLLIKQGARVGAATKSGFTPLAFAVMKNDAASVKRIIQAGSDPNYALPSQAAPDKALSEEPPPDEISPSQALPDKDGTPMLTVAGSYKSFAAEIALLEGGANPNFTDHTGLTPLHVAAEAGAVDLVKELVAKGANLNARTYKATGPKSKFAQYFVNLRLSGEVTPLLLATKADHVDVMHVLIEAGADPSLKAQDGTTLLLAAAGSGHVDAARYAYQFDKDIKAVDDSGRTAMHMSMTGTAQIAQPVLTELVQYLADIGVPMDELDKRGRTPIQVGDGVPIDQPIQRMADIIVSRGGTPRHFPKEYVKPGSKAEK